MKRSSVDKACAFSAALVEHVRAFDLRLLRERRAGGAAFEAFVELAGALVVALRGFFLRL